MLSPLAKVYTAHLISLKTSQDIDDVLPVVDGSETYLPFNRFTVDDIVHDLIDVHGLSDSAPSGYRDEFMSAVESGVLS